MGDNDAETFANITRADFDFDDEAFDAISQDAKDFISALLVKRKEYVSRQYSSFYLFKAGNFQLHVVSNWDQFQSIKDFFFCN